MKKNKIIFGPSHRFVKPDESWVSIDIEPSKADIIHDFNKIGRLPFADDSIYCVYASHVLEHIGIFNINKVLQEICRVLQPSGYFRIIIPDVIESIVQFMDGNVDFPLFKNRERILSKAFGYKKMTLFEVFRCDFISPSTQKALGENKLAHQNAWDFKTMALELERAGFEQSMISEKRFKQSDCKEFSFEGTYACEGCNDWRSLYIEVQK